MFRSVDQGRSIRLRTVGLALVLLTLAPACSANAGSKRKWFGSAPGVSSAPPSGRIAYRPPVYPWWNRPKSYYLNGYAGTNYDRQTREILRETRYQRRSDGHSH